MLDLAHLPRPLIVSCQADPGSPLDEPGIIAAIAEAVVLGGASAVRINSPTHVRAVRARVDVPIVGLNKRDDPTSEVRWITTTFAEAAALAEAGADMIALDATERPREGDEPYALIVRVREELGLAVMADIDTVEAARRATDAGADVIATTLSGYTAEQPHRDGPDLELVRRLAEALHAPIVAEGRFRTAEHVRAALEAGAVAVTIGGAITDPTSITRALLEGSTDTSGAAGGAAGTRAGAGAAAGAG